ncbi:MAG: bifunctional adenosylcobinamide kinase/adenosylcobinamide-phosphate guanylyltransferase [Rhodospirillaceae bacterium]|nr:bifunctional adenosylcobinamide kinase/adenosylcobinamide-phosphate guanylyltransferase [Rhodospirillaceae bacterium]
MGFTLILGGARSGKSTFAQKEAEAAGGSLVMIATAEAMDREMSERIARHRAERGPAWRTVEAPIDLAHAIVGLKDSDSAVVDCLTLWVSNLLMRGMNVGAETGGLIAALEACPARLWLISNETGMGIVPENALARSFRDEAGRLHQRLAAKAAQVKLIVAGLPLTLKG